MTPNKAVEHYAANRGEVHRRSLGSTIKGKHMTSYTQPPPLPKPRRPALVWVISIFYFLSVGYTALSFFLVYSGTIPLDPATEHYLSSLSVFDHLTTVVIAGCNLVASILLLLLRRQAFHIYATAVVITLLVTVQHTIAKGWVQALGGAGLIGAMIGYGIQIAVVTYAYRLNQRGITR